MIFQPMVFGLLIAGVILCLGFFFGWRRSRIRERLQLESKSELALSRPKEEKPLELEFLPKTMVNKFEDKLGLKKGSAKVNELKRP